VIDHLTLETSNLIRAAEFYDACLAPLGLVRVSTQTDAIGWGLAGRALLVVRLRSGHATQAGFHLAFAAASPSAVDSFFSAALAHGGSDDEQRGVSSGYAAIVRDPDGHRIEAICRAV
jgi:catechol 2,3-dioxygenase-like lactoylglutathione lyase family enzyme